MLPSYFSSNFRYARQSHLSGFCENPLLASISLAQTLPLSTSSFWWHEASTATSPNDYCANLGSTFFKKKSYIVYKLLLLFSLGTTRYGRSVLSAVLSLIAAGLMLPKRINIKSFATFTCKPLRCAIEPQLSVCAFVRFFDAGILCKNAKLLKLIFFIYTRLAATPYLGLLDQHLTCGRFYASGLSLELFFFLGLRHDLVDSKDFPFKGFC
jgi:hypothetical protein